MPSILGHPVLRREDPRFLTGQGAFVANLFPSDAAHVAYVTSTEPHARLLSVDVEAAAAFPGVLGVFTAADIDPKVVVYPAPFPGMNDQMTRTMLARDVVRYVGEPVVAVVADDPVQAADAVESVAVDDAGTVLNPQIFEGQIHGGIAGGVAQALMEELAYDADANPLTTNFADYLVVSAAELPSFELIRSETPTDRNLLGAKGVGESGTVGATAAVQNAVIDALSHLGIRHLDMPMSPQRVWKALQNHV